MESGAPMVSIAGGEPLMHKQIDEIVRQLLDRNKIVFLCTNAVLLPKHIDKFTPHRNFAWMVHIDGLRDRHDESVRKIGVFDQAVAAIKEAKARGFRVMTNTTFFDTDTPNDVIELLDYLNDDLGVDNMQISPGYAYERAPDQEHWLGTEQTRALFRSRVRRGPAEEVAAEPLAAVPRLPRGQARVRVHAVGHPVVLAAGLAAAVLPARRRVRADVPGAHRDHRLGRVRPGQGPAVRQLHGALRVRADGGAGHDGLAARDDPRRRRAQLSAGPRGVSRTGGPAPGRSWGRSRTAGPGTRASAARPGAHGRSRSPRPPPRRPGSGGIGRGKLRSYGTPRVAKKPVSTAPGATVDTVTPVDLLAQQGRERLQPGLGHRVDGLARHADEPRDRGRRTPARPAGAAPAARPGPAASAPAG